jgi:gliding motility-associated-like protein
MLTPLPSPVLNNPVINVCSESETTYTLTATYAYQFWTVTGGTITGGGDVSDNFVTVRWGAGPSGTISISAGSSPSCTGSSVVNIAIFNLSGSITSQTDISCNGGSDGSVTALATAGTGQPPYSYSLDGGAWQPGGTFTGLSLGNHIVTIRDGILCTFDLPFIISQPEQVSASIQAKTDVSCFGGTDGSVTILAAGGTPPYQYSLNGGAYQDQNIFNGLAAGNYTLTVRDSHNCTGSVSATITQPAVALNGSVSVINVNCFGDLTGRVDLTVTGGIAPYTFVWSNSATTEDLLNVAAGNYTVVITDSRGCTASVPAVVTQPAAGLAGSTSVVNVLCFGDATGAVDLSVTGGTTPYTFLWVNGAITEDIVNLTAGIYTVTITDGNGCTATASGTVGGPSAAVSGSISSQNNVLCNGGNNGSVTIAGAGGTGPYEYRLGAGAYQALGTFGSLTAGIYAVTIRDASLCTFSLPVNITEPAAALTGIIVSETDVQCFGSATGSVTLSASGGTSPYQFSVDGVTYQSAATFSNLAAGSYSVAIRDNNLCIFNLPVDISQPASAVNGTITAQTNVNCFGAPTGSVMVSGSGGIAPYTYSVDAGPFQATGTFNSLGAGIHNVTVRDLNLCTFNVPVTITQPASALSVTISQTNVVCFGESTGSATATASGGTAPYTWSWNTIPVQTTQSASNLNAGNYTVTVTDNNACVAIASVTISQPAGALTAIASVTDVDCFGSSTGAINLTVTNGTLPISFQWSNGATSEDLTGIPAGTYSVTVTDANGCTANATGTVDQPSLLAGNIAVTDVACFGGSTGSCDLTVSGGISPYTYLWSNGAVTQDISGVVSGNYSVTVTDAHGCTVVVNGTLTQPASTLSGSIISQSDVTVYGGSDGSVTVSGSGATPPYEYSLYTGTYQSSGTFASLTAGLHTVTVRDANLCTTDIAVTISQPIIPLSLNKISQVDVSCNGGATGSVTVEGWGGYTPYEYSINSVEWQPSGTFGSLSAGDYQITVRDTSSAVFSISVTITEPVAFDLTLSSENILCHGGATGSATATAAGGVAPYSYSWNTTPVQTTSSLSNMGPGSYTITVTDNNGCLESGAVTITEPPELILSQATTIASCPDSDDGSVILTIAGGVGPYNVIWSDGVSTQNRTNITPATYSVVATDQNTCAKSLVVEVGFAGSFNCLVIPQVITPNNDGYNDRWVIRNIDIYPDAEMRVFNRWGKLVFRTRNLSADPWDGTSDGKPVPTDSYHYILYLNDGSFPRSGVISVIR